MNEQEIRMECLRLALQNFQAPAEKIVARAQAFQDYVCRQPNFGCAENGVEFIGASSTNLNDQHVLSTQLRL